MLTGFWVCLTQDSVVIDALEDLGVSRDVSLETHNTLAVPARAAHYIELNHLAQLPKVMAYAAQHQLAIFVLGEGSNCVFASDYSGLVVRNHLRGIHFLRETSERVFIRAAAGENWHALVQWCLAKGFHGLENLALIPGTVGAAPIQNIGAYGVEVNTFIHCVHGVDLDTGESRQFSNAECQFGYRESIFKRALRDRIVITDVEFSLLKDFSAVSHYPSLSDQLEYPVTAQGLFDAVCAVRSAKLPNPHQVPNAGSFFKNPIVTAQQFALLQANHPDIVSFTVDSGHKIAAGWLIDQAGWKLKAMDAVVVHKDQALVITNPEHRPGASVLRYAYSIQSDIKQRYGVALEIEPRVIC